MRTCESAHCAGLLCDKPLHEDGDHEAGASVNGIAVRYAWSVGNGHLYANGNFDKPVLHAAFTKRDWSKHNEAAWSAELGYGLEEIVEWTWGQFAGMQVKQMEPSTHCPFCDCAEERVAALEALLVHMQIKPICTSAQHHARLHFEFVQGWIAQSYHTAREDAVDVRSAITALVFEEHELKAFVAGHKARAKWLAMEGGQ